MGFEEWFSTFVDEKDLPVENWEIEDSRGMTHFISSDVVQEFIVSELPESDQKEVKEILIKIDFQNGDVNHFFRYLAKGMVNQFEPSIIQ